MADRVNAHYLGEGKDELGFRCSILEDPVTKHRYCAYSPEAWAERVRFLNQLAQLNQREAHRPHAN